MEITENGLKGEKEYPSILLKNEKLVNWEFVELEGSFPFEVTPESIRGQYDIRVETNFTAPTLKQLKIARYSEFADTLLKLSQLEQIPDFKEKIPMDKLIDDIAFDFDIDVKSIWGMEWSLKREKEQLLEQVRTMAWVGQEQMAGLAGMMWWGAGGPPTGGMPWMPQEWQEQKTVMGVKQPEVPTIENTAPQIKQMM